MVGQEFAGFPEFLELAAERIGRPDLAGPAARISALAAMSNLCGQAVQSDGEHRRSIVAKAMEFRDQLRAASLAADLMIEALAGKQLARDPAVASHAQPADDPMPRHCTNRRRVRSTKAHDFGCSPQERTNP